MDYFFLLHFFCFQFWDRHFRILEAYFFHPDGNDLIK